MYIHILPISLSTFCKWLLSAIWYCSSASSISFTKDLIIASFLSITRSNVWLSISISFFNSWDLAVKEMDGIQINDTVAR